MAALVGWVLNLGLSGTADIAHLPALGVASLPRPAARRPPGPRRNVRAPARPGRAGGMSTPEMLLRLITGLGLGR